MLFSLLFYLCSLIFKLFTSYFEIPFPNRIASVQGTKLHHPYLHPFSALTFTKIQARQTILRARTNCPAICRLLTTYLPNTHKQTQSKVDRTNFPVIYPTCKSTYLLPMQKAETFIAAEVREAENRPLSCLLIHSIHSYNFPPKSQLPIFPPFPLLFDFEIRSD